MPEEKVEAPKELDLKPQVKAVVASVPTTTRNVRPGSVVVRKKDGTDEVIISSKQWGKSFKEDKWVLLESKKK